MATYLIVITSDHLTRALIVSFPFCIGGGVGGVDKSLSVAAFLFCSLPKIELFTRQLKGTLLTPGAYALIPKRSHVLYYRRQ